MCAVQSAQICGKSLDLLPGNMSLACGDEPPREELVDGEYDGGGILYVCGEPCAHISRAAGLCVVVHDFRRREENFAVDDFSAIHDEICTRGARVEWDEENRVITFLHRKDRTIGNALRAGVQNVPEEENGADEGKNNYNPFFTQNFCLLSSLPHSIAQRAQAEKMHVHRFFITG